MNNDYKNSLLAFRKHLERTLSEIVSIEDGDLPEHLEDITITINKRTFGIVLGADTFDMLREMVDFEISQYE